MRDSLTPTTISSLADFERAAPRWNELWDNSNARQPLSRTEGVTLWMKHFGDPSSFRAILIEDDCGRLVGGLAFLQHSRFGLKVLQLPVNCWVNAGELLIHDLCDQEQVIAVLIQELRDTGASFLDFDHIDLNASQWTRLREGLSTNGIKAQRTREQSVGVIDIGEDWAQYLSCLSGNHRSAVKRSEKKLAKKGDFQLLRITNPCDAELKKWMTAAMEIEHRSWKAEAGTSILASEGMPEYFMEEALFANQMNALELWFLMLNDRPIAFEYCHSAKQVCFSYKIGYDEAYKDLGPGRLLRKMQLEFLFNHPTNSRRIELDTMGVLCSAKAKWATRQYKIGKLTASIGGLESSILMQVFQLAKSIKGQLKGNSATEEPIPLGGAKFLV
ncbi:GNAT family N-acetyltransferase [bacterium]|nr:GNAT family N-acetyltransferase [bacterium]